MTTSADLDAVIADLRQAAATWFSGELHRKLEALIAEARGAQSLRTEIARLGSLVSAGTLQPEIVKTVEFDP